MPYLRDRRKTRNSTMFVYKRPMHEHTQMCVNVLYQMFEKRCRDTHIWFVCVCAYALQEDRRQDYLWRFHLLKTIFAEDVAFSTLKFLFTKNHLSNNYYKYREFCNGIKPIKDLGSYNINRFKYKQDIVHKQKPNHNQTNP